MPPPLAQGPRDRRGGRNGDRRTERSRTGSGRAPTMTDRVRQVTTPDQRAGGAIEARKEKVPVLCGLGQAHVDGLEPLGPFLEIELDGLTLFQRAKSVHLDGGVVHKDIGPTVRLRDKAEALFCVEPLDCSGSHGGIPLSSTRVVRRPPPDGDGGSDVPPEWALRTAYRR
jgi:hypothetical protein